MPPEQLLYVYTVTSYRKMINGLRARNVKGFFALDIKKPAEAGPYIIKTQLVAQVLSLKSNTLDLHDV